MNTLNYKTENEIQKTAFDALQKSLGIVGLVRFIQQFDKGERNYTEDRHRWQKEYTVDKICDEISHRKF